MVCTISMNKHKHMVLQMCSQHGMRKSSRYSSCNVSTYLWKSNQTDFIVCKNQHSVHILLLSLLYVVLERLHFRFICRNEDFLWVTPLSQPTKKPQHPETVFFYWNVPPEKLDAGVRSATWSRKCSLFLNSLSFIQRNLTASTMIKSVSRALRSRVSLPTVMTATVESIPGHLIRQLNALQWRNTHAKHSMSNFAHFSKQSQTTATKSLWTEWSLNLDSLSLGEAKLRLKYAKSKYIHTI